ncbi:SsgA family sporulation/cell division regulator [Streptomyces sp. B1866]|uniref:SsgA family sporulation/cell division regulator n=1 Tax=Streptomyces sp. B1866 TaxID=3075431 RepID=UPI00288EA1C9|nr:SsgA family sporulation/cell division regulator [Streptomyces sp. B1866]MDT3396263.1 SsgA family sporulation/cell division regulator [Streptomyces sp. B1866]
MRDTYDTVQAELTMEFLITPDLTLCIPVGLRYDGDDPYAMQITFHLPGDAPVSWTFARDLLLDGLSRTVGEGDVRVGPAGLGNLTEVLLTLQVGGERARFRAQTEPLVAFLDRTDQLVPFGDEHLAHDPAAALEAELARILAEAEDRYAG